MEKILTAAQMRHAEELTEKAGTSTAQLMQNAGMAAARGIAEALARGGPDARVLILCGPGNNGGDGLVAAERLSERGDAVAAYTFRRQEPVSSRPLVIPHEDDPDLVGLRPLVEGSTVVAGALPGTRRSGPTEGPPA